MVGKGKVAYDCCGLWVMLLGLGASYAPSMIPQKRKENLVVAGKLGPEPEILMNMYKLLIEENSDMTVTVKPNFGKTDFLYQALKKGDIDIYPEFTGTITGSLLQPAPKVSNDSKEVFKVARDGIKETRSSSFAQTHGLSKHLCDCCSEKDCRRV